MNKALCSGTICSHIHWWGVSYKDKEGNESVSIWDFHFLSSGIKLYLECIHNGIISFLSIFTAKTVTWTSERLKYSLFFFFVFFFLIKDFQLNCLHLCSFYGSQTYFTSCWFCLFCILLQIYLRVAAIKVTQGLLHVVASCQPAFRIITKSFMTSLTQCACHRLLFLIGLICLFYVRSVIWLWLREEIHLRYDACCW